MAGPKAPAVRVWEAASPHAVLVLSQEYGEASGVHDQLAHRLNDARCTVAAVDHRDERQPHGRRGLKAAVADIASVLSAQQRNHPGLAVFLLGHSRGAAPALGYAVAHQDRLAGLILSAPLAQAEQQRREASLMAGLDTITLATLLLWGVKEGLTPPGGAQHLLGALSHADLTRHSVDGLYHDILAGPARDDVYDTIIAWLDAHNPLSPAA